jgi:thiol:disulfide interchange protein DsbC
VSAEQRTEYEKGLLMFTLLAAFSGAAHADSAAIKQSLAKLGVQSTDIQPSPVSGMSTVLTDSGVLYVTDDGKHHPGADVRRERRAAGQRH